MRSRPPCSTGLILSKQLSRRPPRSRRTSPPTPAHRSYECAVGRTTGRPSSGSPSHGGDPPSTLVPDQTGAGCLLSLPVPGPARLADLYWSADDSLVESWLLKRVWLRPIHVRRACQLPEDAGRSSLYRELANNDQVRHRPGTRALHRGTRARTPRQAADSADSPVPGHAVPPQRHQFGGHRADLEVPPCGSDWSRQHALRQDRIGREVMAG